MKKLIITTGAIAIAGGVATALFMPSCDVTCEDPTDTSLVISLVNEGGGAVGVDHAAGDSLWYEWIDEDGKQVAGKGECVNDDCSEWTVGTGEPGKYQVHASVCGSQYDSVVEFMVDEDGCVKQAKMVNLPVSTAACTNVRAPEPPLPPPTTPRDVHEPIIDRTTCTLEARPSVLAPVWAQYGDMMVPVHADRVFYSWSDEPNERELPGICINEECSVFAAGFEHPGEYVVGAEVCGKLWRASASVGRTADGCHVDTQIAAIIVAPEQCEQPLDVKPPTAGEGKTCQAQIVPSAIIMPVKPEGDVWRAVATENLIYTHDGARAQGFCAERNEADKCLWWIAGFGQTGRFQAFTEVCGLETSVAYSVETGADGCYPKTAFVPVFVDTRGCLTPATPGGNPPSDPTTVPTPGDVTDKPGTGDPTVPTANEVG